MGRNGNRCEPRLGRMPVMKKALFTLIPAAAPCCHRASVEAIGTVWAAMLVTDGVQPPAPGEPTDLSLFGQAVAEAE